MAALILPQRFTSQPQYPAPIDFSNPLTRSLRYYTGGGQPGLVGTKTPSAKFIDSASPNSRYATTSAGVALRTDGTSNGIIKTFGISLFGGWTEFTSFSLKLSPTSLASSFYSAVRKDSEFTEAQLLDTVTQRSVIWAGGAVASSNFTIPQGVIYPTLNRWDGTTRFLYTEVNGATTSVQSAGSAIDTNASPFLLGGSESSTELVEIQVPLMLFWDRRLADNEAASLKSNPWQIFKAQRRSLWAAGPAVQLLRPGSDITAGTWTPSSGASLFATLNESVASDATFDLTSQASTFEVGMTAGTSPGVTTGHVVRYRLIGAVTVSLRQGTTTIASWSQSPTAMTTYVQALTSVQAAAITNYAALSLQFQAT